MTVPAVLSPFELPSSTDPPRTPLSPEFVRVAWTRGSGCRSLASLLSEQPAVAFGADGAGSSIDRHVDALVTRRMTDAHLIPQIVPQRLRLDRVESVTAVIGDGPHDWLAAAVAGRLGEVLGVPVELATVYRFADDLPAAIARMERLKESFPHLGRRIARARTPHGLTDTLAESTLLVVGAAEGTRFDRRLGAPGRSLAAGAPGGAIVVRSAGVHPPRPNGDAA